MAIVASDFPTPTVGAMIGSSAVNLVRRNMTEVVNLCLRSSNPASIADLIKAAVQREWSVQNNYGAVYSDFQSDEVYKAKKLINECLVLLDSSMHPAVIATQIAYGYEQVAELCTSQEAVEALLSADDETIELLEGDRLALSIQGCQGAVLRWYKDGELLYDNVKRQMHGASFSIVVQEEGTGIYTAKVQVLGSDSKVISEKVSGEFTVEVLAIQEDKELPEGIRCTVMVPESVSMSEINSALKADLVACLNGTKTLREVIEEAGGNYDG